MADLLATLQDLADALGKTVADIPSGTLLLECATAVAQEAADNQRILQVIGDTTTLIGTTDSWLDLPQIPVTAVASVTLDGVALAPGIEATQYRRHGNRLWRTDGWQTYVGQPSVVVVVNTHGYPTGAQQLQRARQAVLALAKGQVPNPSGLASESIDDYSATYDRMSAQMEASPYLKASLRRMYGRRGGLVRIG